MNGPGMGYTRAEKAVREAVALQRVIFRVPKKRLDLLRPVLVETELHCEFSYSPAN
jgi:hypothetical protein